MIEAKPGDLTSFTHFSYTRYPAHCWLPLRLINTTTSTPQKNLPTNSNVRRSKDLPRYKRLARDERLMFTLGLFYHPCVLHEVSYLAAPCIAGIHP